MPEAVHCAPPGRAADATTPGERKRRPRILKHHHVATCISSPLPCRASYRGTRSCSSIHSPEETVFSSQVTAADHEHVRHLQFDRSAALQSIFSHPRELMDDQIRVGQLSNSQVCRFPARNGARPGRFSQMLRNQDARTAKRLPAPGTRNAFDLFESSPRRLLSAFLELCCLARRNSFSPTRINVKRRTLSMFARPIEICSRAVHRLGSSTACLFRNQHRHPNRLYGKMRARPSWCLGVTLPLPHAAKLEAVVAESRKSPGRFAPVQLPFDCGSTDRRRPAEVGLVHAGRCSPHEPQNSDRAPLAIPSRPAGSKNGVFRGRKAGRRAMTGRPLPGGAPQQAPAASPPGRQKTARQCARDILIDAPKAGSAPDHRLARLAHHSPQRPGLPVLCAAQPCILAEPDRHGVRVSFCAPSQRFRFSRRQRGTSALVGPLPRTG